MVRSAAGGSRSNQKRSQHADIRLLAQETRNSQKVKFMVTEKENEKKKEKKRKMEPVFGFKSAEF